MQAHTVAAHHTSPSAHSTRVLSCRKDFFSKCASCHHGRLGRARKPMIPGIPSSVQVELENSLEHNSLAKFEGVEKSASEISECVWGVCVCACVRVCVCVY